MMARMAPDQTEEKYWRDLFFSEFDLSESENKWELYFVCFRTNMKVLKLETYFLISIECTSMCVHVWVIF